MFTSPYVSNLATLRMDRLRIEEDRYLELKRLQELERLRAHLIFRKITFLDHFFSLAIFFYPFPQILPSTFGKVKSINHSKYFV
jgi:hypothetical protein